MRGRRLARPPDRPASPLTPAQRLLVLDAWCRSGLPAGDFSPLVLEVFRAAVDGYGAPEEVLTDNGSQYVTWRGKGAFTKELEKRGVRQVVASPHRPQTLGKIERFWGTLWRECLEAAVFVDLGGRTACSGSPRATRVPRRETELQWRPGGAGVLPAWSPRLSRQRPGELGEADQPANPIRRNVLDAVPPPLAGPPQPAPRHVQLQNDYIFDSSAVALDDVKGCPFRFAGRVHPDGFQPALAFAAEQAAPLNAGQVPCGCSMA